VPEANILFLALQRRYYQTGATR